MMATTRVASRRLGHRRRRLMLWTAAVLVVASLWPLAHAGEALIVTHEVAAPDAILMLASHEWERLPAAAAVARKYPEALVLLTVPTVITEHNCHLCRDRVAWLNAEGVESARVRLLPRRAMNTYQEAEAARDYARTAGLKRMVIVTSPYHTRRTWATFEHVFTGAVSSLGIAPAPAAQGNPASWWMTAYDRHYVIYEWAALLKYRAAYGVPIDLE